MTVSVSKYERDALVITVTQSSDAVRITWTGESDSRNPAEFLNPLFARLAPTLAGLHVSVDFSGLTYMNSATVAPLIVSIKSFDASADALLLIFSDMDWQRTHVQCVRAIARSLKNVRIEVRPSTATPKTP